MIIQLPVPRFHRYFSDSVHLPNCQALMTFPEGLSQMADDSPIKAMFLERRSPERPISPRIQLETMVGGPGVMYRVVVQPAPSHRCAASPGTGQVPRADREGGQWTATSNPTSSRCCCLNLIGEGNCPP